MFGNPVVFAAITYALTLVIALMVAGIITLIHRAVSRGGRKVAGDTAAKE
jgi:hypothetical protein